MRRLTVASLETVAGSLLFGQAGPIRPPVNSGAAVRGKRIYLQFCINCHGALAKGTEQGPDLIRSVVVLHDRAGTELGPALGRLAKSQAQSAERPGCGSVFWKPTAVPYELARAPPPREGAALLQGRAVCGRCGNHFRVRYVTRRGKQEAWYVCDRGHAARGEPNCQSIAGLPIDKAIGALVTENMTPAAIELALEIRREIQVR